MSFSENPMLLERLLNTSRHQLNAVVAGLRSLPAGENRDKTLEWMLYLKNRTAEFKRRAEDLGAKECCYDLEATDYCSEEMRELSNDLARLPYEDPSRPKLLEQLFRRRLLETSHRENLSKGVVEGEKVDVLYRQLKTIRNLYRSTGYSITQIRKQRPDLNTVWEWIDRMGDPERQASLVRVHYWEDGDQSIFELIAILYQDCPHLKRKPSSSTVRDWRKAYLAFLKHGAAYGRRTKTAA